MGVNTGSWVIAGPVECCLQTKLTHIEIYESAASVFNWAHLPSLPAPKAE